MTDPTRCEATDHSYNPLPRERTSEKTTRIDEDNHRVEYTYEPRLIYCVKCGWVRRIDDLT